MQGFIGAIVGAGISIIGVWLLTKLQIKEEKKIDLARKRLEKLYGPLMLLVKSTEKLSGRSDTLNASEKQLEYLNRIISEGFYLAESDIVDALVELYEYHFFQEKEKDFGAKIITKIKQKYEKTKKIANVD